MTNETQIHSAIRQVLAQGLTPSVATIKAKLSSPVPLPTLIAHLKSWQQNPKVFNENQVIDKPSVDATSKSDDINNTASLLEKIEQLQTDVNEIKQLLVKLTTQLND